jgi:pSer/pThr/pTyr-binding forkhead associated (FHA) protein
MSDAFLALMRIFLLILIYLFFLRVVRAVWVEVKAPSSAARAAVPAAAPRATATAPSRRTERKAARDRKADRAPAQLVLTEPAEVRGRAFGLSGGEITIGRDAACTVTLDDTYVSSRHARVSTVDGEIVVDDLGSTNGTFVNSRRITAPVVLRPGDRLQVGGAILELR